MSLIFATQLTATSTQLTTAAANFYITCATVIPVLFIAAAVQGMRPGPYQFILQAWRRVMHARETAVAAFLDKALEAFAGRDAHTAAPPKRWKGTRAAAAYVFAGLVIPLLALIALAIVSAGAGGEGWALYVLYQGSEQPGDRLFVLVATLVLGATVVADPVQAYLRRFLGSYLFPLKPGFAFLLQLLSRNDWIAWEAGDAAATRGRYAALLPVYKRVLGPEHQDTLTIRANLAYWTGETGDAAAARDQYAALLPIRKRVLGPEHPATLRARNNLAYWTKRAGR